MGIPAWRPPVGAPRRIAYDTALPVLRAAYRDMALPWWRRWLWPSEEQALREAAWNLVVSSDVKPPPPPAPPPRSDTGYIWPRDYTRSTGPK